MKKQTLIALLISLATFSAFAEDQTAEQIYKEAETTFVQAVEAKNVSQSFRFPKTGCYPMIIQKDKIINLATGTDKLSKAITAVIVGPSPSGETLEAYASAPTTPLPSDNGEVEIQGDNCVLLIDINESQWLVMLANTDACRSQFLKAYRKN